MEKSEMEPSEGKTTTSQFLSIQFFSRKPDSGNRTVDWILNEADRVSGTFVHVENPKPAVLVYGCAISELKVQHERAVTEGRVVIKSGQSRAIRRDQNTLVGIVASHPFLVVEVEGDPAKLEEYLLWEKGVVSWLQSIHGDELKSVVRHTDESHMHIHAFVVPVNLKATDVHPGFAAKKWALAEAASRGSGRLAANEIGDKAYIEAMKIWQDSFHQAVGIHHGHGRTGPMRPRLTRGQWFAQKNRERATGCRA
jgi:hypothetical protein